ncbi:hypothetical protein EIJ81_06655 [Aliivibrio salmonicida]|nr:hypothetical protein EIJ81_06655 [Aliivibrio salmonicida]
MKRLLSLFSIRAVIIIALSIMTSACGFQLRGSYLLPEEVHEVSLTSFDQYSNLTRDVQKQLRMNGVKQVAPTTVTPTLNLISETTSERTLSLYQNSRAAEIELTYTVQYSVLIPGHDLKTYTTTVNRNYLDNPLTALAKSVERDMIEDEMRTQAAEQILRQMARLKADGELLDDTDIISNKDETETKVTTKEMAQSMATSTDNKK